MFTTTRRLTPTRWITVPAGLALGALLLTACSSSEDSSSVASLSGTGTATEAPAEQGTDEQQLLDYVQCLRDQGLDVPDPQVDAEGQLQLGGPPAGGGAPPDLDPDALQTATEVCGELPAGALGGGDVDESELQDAALAFTECLREQGLDVADPDLSGGGPPVGGGPFGDLDPNDPQVQAALEACQGALPGAGNPA